MDGFDMIGLSTEADSSAIDRLLVALKEEIKEAIDNPEIKSIEITIDVESLR